MVRSGHDRVADALDLASRIRFEVAVVDLRLPDLDGLMAMWLIEVGIVQFYDADGAMLRTINLFQEVEPVKLAA